MRNLTNEVGDVSCEKELTTSQSLQETLQRSKSRLEIKLREVNDALEAIDKNPELIKFLEVITKAR